MVKSKKVTREKLIDSAECLFAEQGFDATSVRDITSMAGANLASVNYYFGSKEELLTEVFARRVGPINLERLSLLDGLTNEYANREENVPLKRLFRAFLGPALKRLPELTSGAGHFMRLVGRAHSDSNPVVRQAFKGQFVEVFNRFAGLIQVSAPHLPHAVLFQRFHFVIGAMAHTLAMGWSMEEGDVALEPERLSEELVTCSVAIMNAPVSGGS